MISLNGHKGDVFACASHDGRAVTAGFDKSLSMWLSASGKQIKHVKSAHEHMIRSLAVYAGPGLQNPVVVSGSWDTLVKVWSLSDDKHKGKLLHVLSGHLNRVKIVCALGKHDPTTTPPMAASGGDDGSVCLWNLKEGLLIHKFVNAHSHFVLALDLSPLLLMASGSSDKSLKLWSVQTHEPVATLSIIDRADVTCVLFSSILAPKSPNIATAAAAGDGGSGSGERIHILCSGDASGNIHVHNTSTLELLYSLRGHTDKVTSLCLSKSSSTSLLFSVSLDGYLRSWSLDEGMADRICVRLGLRTDAAIGSLMPCSTAASAAAAASRLGFGLHCVSSSPTRSDDAHVKDGINAEDVVVCGGDGMVLIVSIATLGSTPKSNLHMPLQKSLDMQFLSTSPLSPLSPLATAASEGSLQLSPNSASSASRKVLPALRKGLARYSPPTLHAAEEDTSHNLLVGGEGVTLNSSRPSSSNAPHSHRRSPFSSPNSQLVLDERTISNLGYNKEEEDFLLESSSSSLHSLDQDDESNNDRIGTTLSTSWLASLSDSSGGSSSTSNLWSETPSAKLAASMSPEALAPIPTLLTTTMHAPSDKKINDFESNNKLLGTGYAKKSSLAAGPRRERRLASSSLTKSPLVMLNSGPPPAYCLLSKGEATVADELAFSALLMQAGITQKSSPPKRAPPLNWSSGPVAAQHIAIRTSSNISISSFKR